MILPKLTFKWERWKFNSDYGIYASTLGHFKDRHKRDIPVKINNKGYVMIKTEQGYRLAHRLVMLTWRPTDDAENLTVDHLNHNKRDNSLVNLEWVTEKENKLRARNDYIAESEEVINPKKRKQIAETHIRVFKEGKVCATFSTEEEFADFILSSTKKKAKRSRKDLVELAKNCKRKASKERELLGYTWKWVKKTI